MGEKGSSLSSDDPYPWTWRTDATDCARESVERKKSCGLVLNGNERMSTSNCGCMMMEVGSEEMCLGRWFDGGRTSHAYGYSLHRHRWRLGRELSWMMCWVGRRG